MKSILAPCTNEWDNQCPEVFVVDEANSERPFCITDLPAPRGTARFSQAELLSLAGGGSEAVSVTCGEQDTLIVDALGNELYVTNTQFDDLVTAIKNGSAHKAMMAAIA